VGDGLVLPGKGELGSRRGKRKTGPKERLRVPRKRKGGEWA
jgi:hypothetical protein